MRENPVFSRVLNKSAWEKSVEKTGKSYRVWQIINSLLWIGYDLLSNSYGPLITHFVDYMQTQEGKNLPAEHCIKDTDGWQICNELKPYVNEVVDKITFGSVDLPKILHDYGEEIEKIELCGLCTDICVISNAMILKATFPEAKIAVDSKCCAGVSTESHNTALDAMKTVQIEVK